MFKANFGFEFDTKEKVNTFNDGAWICFSGCFDIAEAPDAACKNCVLINECIGCNQCEQKNLEV